MKDFNFNFMENRLKDNNFMDNKLKILWTIGFYGQ